MVTNRPDINNVLNQMRELQNAAKQSPLAAPGSDVANSNALSKTEASTPSFNNMFKNAVDSVNSVQKQSAAMATAYEKGDPNISLSDVMVASQKASVSFQAAMQVRNKLVEAYKEVMNMPI